MKQNRIDELKDKVVGSVQETTGKLSKNKELEMQGKMRSNLGRARGIVNDLADEVDDVKNNVVGSVKEVAGKVSDDETLELRGKLQKAQASNEVPKKLLVVAGVVATALIVRKIMKNKKKNK